MVNIDFALDIYLHVGFCCWHAGAVLYEIMINLRWNKAVVKKWRSDSLWNEKK